jgi:hypothetical protein
LFPLCVVVFAKMYFNVLPSRASNRHIHSEYFFFLIWYICLITPNII